MADRRDLELVAAAIILEARRGRGDWQWLFDELYFVLPEEFRAQVWFELAQTPTLGHALAMLAHKAKFHEPLPRTGPPPSEPKLKGPARAAAEHLLDHPFAGPRELMRVARVSSPGTAARWPNARQKAWIKFKRHQRGAAFWERERSKRLSQWVRHISEPIDAALKADADLVGTFDAMHPGSTAEAVEKATGIPASLVLRWRPIMQIGSTAERC